MSKEPTQRDITYNHCAMYLLSTLKDCGVPENDHLRDDVYIFSRATKVLDDLVDTTVEEDERVKKQTLYLQGGFEQITNGNDLEVLTAMNNVLLRRGTRQEVLDLLEGIFKIQERIRAAINPNQYYDLLQAEGVLYSKIVIQSLRGDTNKTFENVCAPLIQSMYLFDSLLDGEEDFRKGETLVKPDLRFYITGTQLLIRKFTELLYSYPKKRVVFKESLRRMFTIALALSKRVMSI